MDPRELTTAIPRFLICVYQALSSGLPHRCRFAPSCSQYMADALQTKGLLKGLAFGLRRILKCHPWHPGGYDPITENVVHPNVVRPNVVRPNVVHYI